MTFSEVFRMTKNENDNYISIDEAAEYLGITVKICFKDVLSF